MLVADSPLGPFKPFRNRSTLPTDVMTPDGTLWVEDGVPYMVYAHEWVQITDGRVEMIRLKDDLSETVGEPARLFELEDAGDTLRIKVPFPKRPERRRAHHPRLMMGAPLLYYLLPP